MADTDQTLTRFYQTAQDYGFSRDYQARVEHLKINGIDYPQDGLLYIKDFSVPGVKRSVSTVKYFGVDVHSPGTRDYGESNNWSVTFYVDQALAFRFWLEQRATETAINNGGQIRQHNQVPTETDLAQIVIYDDQLIKRTTYYIYGLFVIDVPAMSYSLTGNGKAQEIKVKFGYQYWDYLLHTPSTPSVVVNNPVPSAATSVLFSPLKSGNSFAQPLSFSKG